jgi:hypothetical protein
MRVAKPPGVAGVRGGKVLNLCLLSLSLSIACTPPSKNIQMFRCETLCFLIASQLKLMESAMLKLAIFQQVVSVGV